MSGGSNPRPPPKHHSGGGSGGTNVNNVYSCPISADAGASRIDAGVDYGPGGTIYALGDGKVDYAKPDGWGGTTTDPGGWYVQYTLSNGPLAGFSVYLAEHITPHVQQGQTITSGQHIATIGNNTEMGWSSAPDVPLGYTHTGGNAGYLEGQQDAAGLDFANLITKLGGSSNHPGTASGVTGTLSMMPYASKGQGITGPGPSPGPGGGTGGGTTGGSGGGDPQAIAQAASISTFLNFPGLEVSAESIALRGERSLLNDQQLLPFIEQLCQSSLRSFQSMPDGTFFAFFPDYFGGLSHRTAYWEIHDIEIIDGQIQLSDDALATHVFVTGDTNVFDGQVTVVDEINTAGVATIFNAFKADFLNGVNDPSLTAVPPPKGSKGSNANNSAAKQAAAQATQTTAAYQKQIANLPSLADKTRAIAFLQKYGARPYREDAPMVRSHFFEMFLAYQKFMLMWSRQFITTFQFTFMPELFPGGIISFPEHGIQCYIDEVVHQCDYETGFTTQANLSAPCALPGSKNTKPKRYVHEGMIRAAVWANPTAPTVPVPTTPPSNSGNGPS